MDTEIFKPILAGMVRHGLTTLGGALVTDGVLQSSEVTGFIGAGMVVAGAGWSWYQKVGQAKIAALLKKVMARSTVAAAVEAAKVAPTGAAQAIAKILLVAFALSLFLPLHAFAADLPVKTTAPAAASFLTGAYPYDNSGFFVGVFTEGTGGSVAASVPGVNSASLTTTTAALGLTAGYAWGTKGSPIAYTLEGDFKVQNFNGNNAGLSLQGPLGFAVRGLVFAPWDRLFSGLNIVNPFGAVPPFAALQPGVTASNLQFGAGLEFAFNDISLSYLGVPAGKVWQFEPKLDFVQMQQLSNGTAVRTFEKIGFPDKGAIIGPAGARAVQGIDVTFGLGAYF